MRERFFRVCSRRPCKAAGAALAALLLTWVSCGRESPETYIKQLERMDASVRIKAANQLIRFEADEVVPLLVEEADSGYIRVRFEVMKLLGRFKDPRGVSALVQGLDDKSVNVAQAAAWALSEIGAPEALPALLQYARAPSKGVRAHVVRALGPCHSYEREPALSDSAYREVLRALQADVPKVRIAGLQSIRDFGYREVAAQVIRMSRDPSPEVRHVAVQALGEIGAARAGEGLDSGGQAEVEELPAGAARIPTIEPVSERMRTNIVEALLVALDEGEYQSIRTKAVRALALIGDARVAAPLQRLADQGTEEDRREVGRALEKLVPPPSQG